ncbi:MAG: nucleotidyltransferase domain-containing protein [Pyrinomonadaceae bacterium]
MQERILNVLDEIESSEGVRIFYACESGSREWGFPSADSDYDVRFLYVRPEDWYFSINVEEKRDVIERLIVDILDVGGWDLRKALQLLRKSNPPLLEWLNSPIVYRQTLASIEQLRELVPLSYSPIACFYHYLSMARGNYREYLKGELVRVKKYFYVLRPILAAKWIEAGHGIAPVKFRTLVERMVTDSAVRVAIDELIERKRAGEELDREPQIPVLTEFIAKELEILEATKLEPSRTESITDRLDTGFRTIVRGSWVVQH